ncbi:helix-turn-helix domain-containing protein [Flagellimonas aequoris]|uniref:AraC family transcriptional regulator n=1 Tax=Flagellimonas aequoris TaxID=2306997 RepID=A0A418N9C9_9FLAO|nr:AraC family transcriptional regulator [Allomuricauda aequoris]RIV72102.1 AraC family transcriptional regulator [Allomuricauda aequoris]TXK03875.1 helix-turn-helix transcriptional regulator [Allomuricauda aequoris]
MKVTDIKSCYIGPEISPEQFVPEHFFLFIAKGTIHGYDGDKYQSLRSGEYCLVRKNRLARYNKERENVEFEKVVIIFDEPFLKAFQEKHALTSSEFLPTNAFFPLKKNELVPNFIRSLMPYYNGVGKLDETFADIKREELLLILLRNQPELANLFFDYGTPEKINLEAFMNRNYKFNVSTERFAYLTGRSLSSFKRDFKQVFQETPSRWLQQRRLREAHFLLDKKNKRPSEIYLDLGFEDLSHFSFAFKKTYGMSPTELYRKYENS